MLNMNPLHPPVPNSSNTTPTGFHLTLPHTSATTESMRSPRATGESEMKYSQQPATARSAVPPQRPSEASLVFNTSLVSAASATAPSTARKHRHTRTFPSPLDRTAVAKPRTPTQIHNNTTGRPTPTTARRRPGSAVTTVGTEHSRRSSDVTSTRQELARKVPFHSEIRCAAVIGHRVYVGCKDGSITACDARTGDPSQTPSATHNTGAAVWCMLSVGTRIWAGYSNGDVEVFETSPVFHKAFLMQKHTGGVHSMAEFGGYVHTGSNDFEIFQWHAGDATFVRQLAGHTNYVRTLCADGSALYSGSDDNTIRVWDVTSGQCTAVLRHHTAGVSSVIRVGTHMWSADDIGKIYVWEVATHDIKATLSEHQARVMCMKKIGSRVYSGGADHEVVIWDCTTWQLLGKVLDHRGWVTCVTNPSQLTRYAIWTTANDNTLSQFFHEEYHAVTPDRSRFDDAHWYYAQYNPYEDLNARMREQVEAFEQKVRIAREEFSVCAEKLDRALRKIDGHEEEKQILQDNYQLVCNTLREVTEQKMPSLQNAMRTKEDALSKIEEELKTARQEVIQLKYGTVEVDSAMAEAQRRAKVLQHENDVLKQTLDELKSKQREQLERDTAHMVKRMEEMQREFQAGSTKLTEELRIALMMNDTLRDQNQSLRKEVEMLKTKQQMLTSARAPRPPAKATSASTSNAEPKASSSSGQTSTKKEEANVIK
eukprot:PhM_4_TR19024/c0_g2_i1/m.8912/K10260/FBXW7, SEL10; F-box and WD-40 domain protein 7